MCSDERIILINGMKFFDVTNKTTDPFVYNQCLNGNPLILRFAQCGSLIFFSKRKIRLQKLYDLQAECVFCRHVVRFLTNLSVLQQQGKVYRFLSDGYAAWRNSCRSLFFKRFSCLTFFCWRISPTICMFRATIARAIYRLKPWMPWSRQRSKP